MNWSLIRMVASCRVFIAGIDIRFQSKSEEMRFKQSFEKSLCKSIIVLCFLFVSGGVFVCYSDFLTELQREDGRWKFSLSDPRTFRYASTFLTFIFLPCLTLLTFLLGWRFPRVRSCLGYLNFEYVAVVLLMLPNVMVPLHNGWTAAKLYGKDPSDVWVKDMRGSDTAVALAVDAITTLLCLFVPIRMCLRWIPAFAGAISFAIYSTNWAPFPDHSGGNTFGLCCLTFAALWGAWRNEREARQNFVAQSLVRRKSREIEVQHAGASRILDRLCDGLVELDSDLCIRDPNPRFAALLLKPKQALEGTNFCDYLSSDSDKQRFVDALQGDHDISDFHDADMNRGMVQVSLRDASKDFIVYVYYARIFDAAGARGHMIALVEAQERMPPPNALPVPDALPLEVCRLPSVRSDESGSSWASSEAVPVENVYKEDVVAWIDINSEELTILKCSMGFTMFGPISEGSSFVSLVAKDAFDFRKWFQKAVNVKVHGLFDTPIEPYSLRLRTKQNAKIEFATKCRPHFGMTTSAGSNETDDTQALCIVFSEVKIVKRKKASPWQLPQRCMLTSSRASPAIESAFISPTLSL